MGLDLNKSGVELVNDAGASIDAIEAVFAWEDAPATGWKAKVGLGGGVDVDVYALVYARGEVVGFVSPEKRSALQGTITHGGDVKKGRGEDDGERIIIQLSRLREVDSDIDGIALVAACEKGNFDKVAFATARLFDVSNQDAPPSFLGNVRVGIQGGHCGVVIGALRREGTQWTFTKAEAIRSATARTWQQLAGLAEPMMR